MTSSVRSYRVCYRNFIVVPYADNGLKMEKLPSGIALVSISEVGKEIAGR